ncbi:hypothetical protein FACS1894164_16380 [Spirochaetia bacterium]|nr:hypothetical protein FACS1894164_16380 [Spirochaetia bacterium]
MSNLALADRYIGFDEFMAGEEDPFTELYDGEEWRMAPPSDRHQKISMMLSIEIGLFLKGKPEQVRSAPYGVQLFPDEDTVVLPDLVVIKDPGKIDRHGCTGAPDLVVEILSPSNASHDSIEKYALYERAGVPEYWIVDPDQEIVYVALLQGERYEVTKYKDGADVPVAVVPGLVIHSAELWK